MGYSAPRGTVDILPGQSEKWIKLEQLLRTIAANYNVKEMRTPIFEHAELFNRAVGDTSDVVSKEMYTFQDKKGRYISLRPEGTAGIARAYVENKMYGLPEKLQKVYYMGPMFRYERPHNESRDAYREALKDHFRDHLDELCGDCKARFEKNPLRILDCKVDAKHPAMKTAPKTIDYLSESAKNHFDKVCSLLDDLEIDYVIDTNLVSGLDYYSHTVFEIISDDPKLGAGATVGGGGRYNGLIEEIGGPATPGVGFAFGMERLLLALDDEEDEDEDGLDCYIMPLGEEAKDLAMQIIAMLRANGFTCEMDHVSRGLKGQFKSADRFNAHFSIILGEEEVKNEVVNIKCNHDKEQEVVPLENILAHIENHLSGGHEHE